MNSRDILIESINQLSDKECDRLLSLLNSESTESVSTTEQESGVLHDVTKSEGVADCSGESEVVVEGALQNRIDSESVCYIELQGGSCWCEAGLMDKANCTQLVTNKKES